MTGVKAVRNPHDRLRVNFETVGESMTDTSHAAAADINYIVERFARSGQLPPVTRPGVYDDVSHLQVDGLLQLIDLGVHAAARAAAAHEIARAQAAEAAVPDSPPAEA